MPIPPPTELDPEAALDALYKMMVHGARDPDFEVALYRALLNSPNREAALMAKCAIGLMIGDGRIKLDEDEEVPADLAEPLVTVVLPDDDILEAMFQEFRSKLRAVCTLSDKDPVVVFPKLGEIRPE